MKIAIAVHGRFEAFDLARELLRRGHDVSLLTNYPAWAVEPFGIPRAHVVSFWPHGVLTRGVARLGSRLSRHFEPGLHRLFGRWAAAMLSRRAADVVCVFSGVAEETFRPPRASDSLRVLVRASSHIRTQDKLLREEALRTGIAQERPSPWMISREEHEYGLAPIIRVLSRFALQTFVEQGVPVNKMKLVASGVQTEAFRPSARQLEARCERLLSGAPLRVLNVGTFSFRKGIWDTAAVIRTLGTLRYEFRFVGPITEEAARLAEQLRRKATFVPKQPQPRLAAAYAWGDVFMLPSIEDGYPAVLAQAAASGLPILTTPNGGGWDLVEEGANGWVLPIRSPDRFVERLRWADTHRPQVVDMIRANCTGFRVRDSADVASDFEQMCAEQLGTRAARR
jgi:glycosyltransferase involved in cell wall biosynthesis